MVKKFSAACQHHKTCFPAGEEDIVIWIGSRQGFPSWRSVDGGMIQGCTIHWTDNEEGHSNHLYMMLNEMLDLHWNFFVLEYKKKSWSTFNWACSCPSCYKWCVPTECNPQHVGQSIARRALRFRDINAVHAQVAHYGSQHSVLTGGAVPTMRTVRAALLARSRCTPLPWSHAPFLPPTQFTCFIVESIN